MIPLSVFIQGLIDASPYLVGAVGIAVGIGLAIPVKKKIQEEVHTIVREEIQDNVKIVTRLHKREVAVDYDIFLKMLHDYEKMKQEAQKEMLTQLALMEAKKEEEKDKKVRDLVKLEDAYKDVVKVKVDQKKPRRKDEDEVELDTSELQ